MQCLKVVKYTHTQRKLQKFLNTLDLTGVEVKQTSSSKQLSDLCVRGPVVKDKASDLEVFIVIAGDWTHLF